jgi:hypothetical protein
MTTLLTIAGAVIGLSAVAGLSVRFPVAEKVIQASE